MGDAERCRAAGSAAPVIPVINSSDLNQEIDDSDAYAICMHLNSIRAIRVKINGRIDRSAPAQQEAVRQHPGAVLGTYGNCVKVRPSKFNYSYYQKKKISITAFMEPTNIHQSIAL